MISRSMGGWRQRFRKGLECRAVKTKKKSHVCNGEGRVRLGSCSDFVLTSEILSQGKWRGRVAGN